MHKDLYEKHGPQRVPGDSSNETGPSPRKNVQGTFLE